MCGLKPGPDNTRSASSRSQRNRWYPNPQTLQVPTTMSVPSCTFNGPDADVILRAPLEPGSDELKDFYVHKLILSIASTIFRDTFSAPPLSEELPVGTKVFFLGKQAYGAPAQISKTTDPTLSVVLAVSGFLC